MHSCRSWYGRLARVSLALFLVSSICYADDSRSIAEEAKKAYAARDYARARALLNQACTGGDAAGCFSLGKMLTQGWGGPQDNARAREVFGRACKGGVAEGCTREKMLYGTLCREGDAEACSEWGWMLVNEKYERSGRRVLEKACKGGSAKGCYRLGLTLSNGQGGPQDKTRAQSLFKQACKDGISQACSLTNAPSTPAHAAKRPAAAPSDMRSLAEEARKAYAVKDYTRARALFDRACTGGKALECYWLAMMCAKGQGGPRDRTHARTLFEQACKAGNAESCLERSRIFVRGQSNAPYEKRARALFDRVCKGGDAGSCFSLAGMLSKGRGGPQDMARARRLFDQACKAGNAKSCSELSSMLVMHQGGPRDENRAQELLDQACKGGDAQACYRLGMMLNGKDEARARELFDQACKGGYTGACIMKSTYDKARRERAALGQACTGGNAMSCFRLGMMFNNGVGGQRDKARAHELFAQACNGGLAAACSMINKPSTAARASERPAVVSTNTRSVAKEAQKAYAARNFARARNLFDEACKTGNAMSCFRLGIMFNNGVGGQQDKARAQAFFDRACKGGYTSGCSMKSRYDAERRRRVLSRKDCTNGNAMGCYRLGMMLKNGVGGPQDMAGAQAFFEQACKGGFATACSLTNGSSAPPRAAKAPAAVSTNSKRVTLEANHANITGHFARARQLFDQACTGGDANACLSLGVMLRDADGGPQDLARARQLFDQACKDGVRDACSAANRPSTSSASAQRVSSMRFEGKVAWVRGDFAHARTLFEQLCDGGDAYGCDSLGLMASKGQGAPQDKARARALFAQACKGGFKGGCEHLHELENAAP